MLTRIDSAELEKLQDHAAMLEKTLDLFTNGSKMVGIIAAGPRVVGEEYEWLVRMGQTEKTIKTANGKKSLLPNLDPKKLKTGAMVLVQETQTIQGTFLNIIENMPDELIQVKVLNDFTPIHWNQVGGLKEAKEELQSLVDMLLFPVELHEEYKIQIPKGILLTGPPGNGKTLLAKALASALLAEAPEKAKATVFSLVSGPELLSMWVGVAESKIRSLFEAGREHYKKFGSPSVIVIDEADALLGRRENRDQVSGVEKTTVPQFLTEMDGFKSGNPIVVLTSNLPNSLDPAVLREGRVDLHINIPRPNQEQASDVLGIYLKEMKIKDSSPEDLIDVIIGKLFSCPILKPTLSGAMLHEVVKGAARNALRRDQKAKSKKASGVNKQDFLDSISKMQKGKESF